VRFPHFEQLEPKGITMKLKLNQNGTAVVRNGMPVYVHANGREEEFDAPAAMKLAVGKHFESSKVAGGLKIPHEIAAAAFGDSFRIEKGQLVAYAGDAPMYSGVRHGQLADFEEALGQLIDRYPSKSMILREPGAPAPAPSPAPGRQQGKGGAITRAQFNAMNPIVRGRYLNDGGRVVDSAAEATTPAPATRPANSITRQQFEAMGAQDCATHFKNGGKVVD
jgi:hypothetical protein